MKKAVLLIVKVLVCELCFSQAITFNKTYDYDVDNLFNVLEITNGYLMVINPGFNLIDKNIEIVKTDFYGNVLFQKNYGDSDQYHLNYGLVRTYDNNYVTGAYNYDITDQRVTAQLMKINDNGDTLWTNEIIPPSGFEYLSSYVIQTSDNGFLITGQIGDSLFTTADAIIIKTDSLGNEQWHAIYGGNNFDCLVSSIQLPDNSYLSLGWTRSFGFGNNNNRDVYLVKTDSAGNFVWQKTFGTPDFETGTGITSLSDNNFILASTEGPIATLPAANGVMYKIDTAGNIVWRRSYVAPYLKDLWWVKERYDHTLVGVGSNRNVQTHVDSGWVFKADSAGYQLWERGFMLNNNYSYFRDVQCTSDGGYICSGFCFQGATGGQDAWLVKLDSMGCDSAGCPTITAVSSEPTVRGSEIELFPNPAKEKIVIAFSHSLFTAARITIYDVMGKQVFQMPAFIQKQISIPVYQLPSGIYFVEINFEGKKQRIKFMKE